MNFNLTYTNSRILRQNLPLLLGLCSLCLISFFIVYLNILQYRSNEVKIKQLESEIGDLARKKGLLDFKSEVIDSEFDLDSANRVLNQLIPVKEDYFSILAAFDKLSVQTKFIINSYNILVDSSTAQKLAILIEGQGNPETFLEFLKEYNFAGGRLITIDNIEYSQDEFTGVKINIYVYSGSASTVKRDSSTDVDIALIANILDKVQVEMKAEETAVLDYPTKQNPF